MSREEPESGFPKFFPLCCLASIVRRKVKQFVFVHDDAILITAGRNTKDLSPMSVRLTYDNKGIDLKVDKEVSVELA